MFMSCTRTYLEWMCVLYHVVHVRGPKIWHECAWAKQWQMMAGLAMIVQIHCQWDRYRWPIDGPAVVPYWFRQPVAIVAYPQRIAFQRPGNEDAVYGFHVHTPVPLVESLKLKRTVLVGLNRNGSRTTNRLLGPEDFASYAAQRWWHVTDHCRIDVVPRVDLWPTVHQHPKLAPFVQ